MKPRLQDSLPLSPYFALSCWPELVSTTRLMADASLLSDEEQNAPGPSRNRSAMQIVEGVIVPHFDIF